MFGLYFIYFTWFTFIYLYCNLLAGREFNIITSGLTRLHKEYWVIHVFIDV